MSRLHQVDNYQPAQCTVRDCLRAGEMSHLAGALTTLSEGTSWIPSTHLAVVAPALVDLASSSGLRRHQTHRNMHTHTHTLV